MQSMHRSSSGSCLNSAGRMQASIPTPNRVQGLARLRSAPSRVRRSTPSTTTAAAVADSGTDVVAVGDIGGTNARLSVWRTDGHHSSAEIFAKTYPTAAYKTFEAVMRDFLKEPAVAAAPPQAAALAVAGAVVDQRCAMTNLSWLVDGPALAQEHGIKVALLNDFEAVGYGIPALGPADMIVLNEGEPTPNAPKVVMGPGTGLGAAQLMWDQGEQAYVVWPGEGSHATFAPRGWKQHALGVWAAHKLGGHVEIEHLACGSGLELIYEFLLSDEPGNRQDMRLGGAAKVVKTAAEISKAALEGSDPLACEAVDLMMGIVGAEAGAMALRCLAKGGVYIAGGITPKLLPRLRASPSGGGALLEGFLNRGVRQRFADILQSMPLAVITNEKVGQVGAREYARKLLKQKK